MWGDRERRGPKRSNRAFQPGLDGLLETRMLLSGGVKIHAAPDPAAIPPAHFQTANGGRAVIIRDGQGQSFEVTVTSLLQGTGPQLTAGTVRATRGPNGSVNLIVDGTTAVSQLAINPVVKSARKGGAHTFGAGNGALNNFLAVNSINVTSGTIGQIVGFHSAILVGPIVVGGPQPVNRIAFEAIEGGSIFIGGSLDTLDVVNDIDLTGGGGINVGQDLNWFDAGGNLILGGGASIFIGRDIGQVAQPAKGSGPAGVGGFVAGNVNINPGSQFFVTRAIDQPIVVEGNLTGASRIVVGQVVSGFQVRGTVTP